MPLLELRGVHYAHSQSVPLLRDVHLRLEPGFTGVVGANGAGKTTLLRLLAGALRPDAGVLKRLPAGMAVELCAQEVEGLPESVCALAAGADGERQRLRGRLRLDPAQLERWASLSPGERKRWQIAAALARRPDALLLDEPTNHLDAEARDELVAALAGHRGIGVVVSHDRQLLEALCDHTVRIHAGTVSLYRGAYAQARATWQAAARAQRSTHERLRHERRKERKRLADKRRARSQAEARMRTRRNMKSAQDSDARLRGKQKRRRSAEVSLGRDVRRSRRRLSRIDEALKQAPVEQELGGALFVDYVPARLPHLMVREARPLIRGGRVLASELAARVARDSRVHLVGPNGVGKTSLLEELVDAARLPADRILHLPQELSEQRMLQLLEDARRLEPTARGRLLKLVASLGVDPGQLLASARPSPGEARKLALADGLARQVQALVLDEPTNHLDLPSIERLEQALVAYPGALLLVSHDDAFASRLCGERWRLEAGRLRVEPICG